MNKFEEQLDSVDASVFTGDALEYEDNRAILSLYLDRWGRAINHSNTNPKQGGNKPMKELFELFKRGVEALEKIAEQGLTAIAGTGIQTQAPGSSMPPDYDSLSPEAIKSMCEARGIEIPKGVRTATLIKKLQARDEADAAMQNPVPDAEEAAEEANSGLNESLDTTGSEELDMDDPFDGIDASAEGVWTTEEVRATLQHWWSDQIGVDKSHKEYPVRMKAATGKLMGLIQPYGCKSMQALDEKTGIQIMKDHANLREIYETRVKGEV